MSEFNVSGRVDPFSSENLDSDLLARQLAGLDDRELAKLEDELDFCAFTGVPSVRILKLLRRITELDEGWKAQLGAETGPMLPQADFSGQRPAVKRGNRNSRSFQPVSYCA